MVALFTLNNLCSLMDGACVQHKPASIYLHICICRIHWMRLKGALIAFEVMYGKIYRNRINIKSPLASIVSFFDLFLKKR